MQLRIPGPTPCPPQALEAMGRQMIPHRGKEFAQILASITAKLQHVFQTKGDVLVLTASGTGGLEAAIVNVLSPGDRVLSASNGVFGDRFADIAEAYGALVTRLTFEWGQPVDPDAVKRALSTDPGIKAGLVTHNETSTGVTNDLEQISAVVRDFDKLLLVDAVSSLSSINLPVDDWQCDVVISGSQKGWMIPPGLTMLSISQKAWQAQAKAKMPRFYWDFTKARDYLQRGQTPWTPSLSLCFALDATLDLILEEGLSNVFARHSRVARVAREGVAALGLSLFARASHASDTVTAVNSSDSISIPKLVEILKSEHGIDVAGGQKKLSGKIFRIGHLGFVYEADIRAVLEALAQALPKARA